MTAPPLDLDQDVKSPSSTLFSPNALLAESGGPSSVNSSQLEKFSTSATRSNIPFGQSFETPRWSMMMIHVVVCGLAYPVLLGFVKLADGESLFIARLMIGLGCGIVGLALGVCLLNLSRAIFEAATWATIIHHTMAPDEGGIRLGDLAAYVADHGSPVTALRLLYDRYRSPGTSRQHRKSYDNRWWSFYVLLFLINCIVAASLSFALGRLVDIRTEVTHQAFEFEEVSIMGVLTQEQADDIALALPDFDDPDVTWTTNSVASQGAMPPVVSLEWENNTVYISETIIDQLLPDGSGGIAAQGSNDEKYGALLSENAGTITKGSLLRFPQWGLRTKCAKIPNGETNIYPLSSERFSYVFIPRDVVKPLFDYFSIPLPDAMNKRYNISTVMALDNVDVDSLDATPDLDTIAAAARFGDNGISQSLVSQVISGGEDGAGFVTLETVLIRLNTDYTPHGQFSMLANIDKMIIGFDSAVCLQVYQPYVMEIYNSSIGMPSTIRIVNRTAEIQVDPHAVMIGSPLSDPTVQRALNSTSLTKVYRVAHQNSVNTMLKDNGPAGGYRPSPSVLTYSNRTDNHVKSYEDFIVDQYEYARSLSDARNILPYFAGSGKLLAQRYSDKAVTTSQINNIYMAVALGCVLILGLISGFFVPRLPFGQPRRGFDLYSWMSAFSTRELASDKPDGISKNMELKDIIKHNSNIRLRHITS